MFPLLVLSYSLRVARTKLGYNNSNGSLMKGDNKHIYCIAITNAESKLQEINSPYLYGNGKESKEHTTAMVMARIHKKI